VPHGSAAILREKRLRSRPSKSFLVNSQAVEGF
jgi:hypothetical protein